jgi:tetratricopeptide (TPR) repeat protein
MASLIDKYEKILAADPRSRIFVELAKALVERGDLARAVEVCSRGLEHHPGSILGRVTWGRALLESGDPKGALEQFERALALEPSSPYACNHVAETLLAKGMHREALPAIARAAELQPADARVKAWLEEVRRELGEEAVAAVNAKPTAIADVTATSRATSISTEPPHPDPLPRLVPGERENTQTLPRLVPAEGEDARTLPGLVPGERENSRTPPAPPPLPAAAAPNPASPTPDASARSVLFMLPEESTKDVIGPSLASRLDIPAPAQPAARTVPEADPAAAEREAAEYERTLREKLLAEPEPPPSFLHRRRVVLGGALAVALAAAAGVYLYVTDRNAALAAAGAASRGRAGLARDTLASLREAHRLLSDARKRSADPEVTSLAAQVAAVLAAEHGDDEAGEVARALVASGTAGDGAVAARWLLAATAEDRAAAEAALLAPRPAASPLLQALAGRVLVARGETAGGRGRLELAARANPPLLRALSDLGDLSLRAGDPEAALAYYVAALTAQPTHARSAVGAAEARVALQRDLDVARKELDAIDGDPGSAPSRDLRVRFEIARARVYAALGDPAGAAARLARAAEKAGESAALAAALAEVQLQARAWDKAESAAARAVALEPREADHRVLLARARIARGRYAEALAATDGADGRAVRIQRAIARYRLGHLNEARAELEGTARDGKLAAEAAVWYALVDVAAGKADRALPLLERLVQAKTPPPLAHVALGRAYEALGKRREAEAAYRRAIEREPLAPEAHAALGQALVAAGRARDALVPLERAVRLDASDLAARRALGAARLHAGQPAAARADLDVVLLSSPKDVTALRLVSAAWLAEGQPKEARLAAERALAVTPRDPTTLLTAARAAVAAGDANAGRKLAERALKAGAKGAERDEAKKLAGGRLARNR